jgi:hypothetical protein
MVYDATGKYEKLADFHHKVRKVLVDEADGVQAGAQKRNNGQVEYYRLNEVQSQMVMASVDIKHLRLISKVFVKVKSIDSKNLSLLSPEILSKLIAANSVVDNLVALNSDENLSLKLKVDKLTKAKEDVVYKLKRVTRKYSRLDQDYDELEDKYLDVKKAFSKVLNDDQIQHAVVLLSEALNRYK